MDRWVGGWMERINGWKEGQMSGWVDGVFNFGSLLEFSFLSDSPKCK